MISNTYYADISSVTANKASISNIKAMNDVVDPR